MIFITPYGGAAMIGAILGFAQWLVLKRYTTKASWWILISTIALMLGAGWVMALSIQLETFISFDRWIKSCLASGLIGGTIKGGALVWLLQHPKKDYEL
jgi:xanthine/uracil permease